jgi:hypothetical protein
LFLRHGATRASRSDFAGYLTRLTAFDTKYDRVQPSFYAHFSLARGIALFYPDNVHKYIDRVSLVADDAALHALAVRSWFRGQAEMFARLEYFHRRALENGLGEDPALRAVMDLYEAGSKTEFLEELLVLGSMPPSVSGLKDFVANLPPGERGQLSTGIENDTELTPQEEQAAMKRRWIDFRTDLIATTALESRCETVTSADTPGETLMLQVNERRITLADYLAVFGRMGDRRFNATKRANCNRLALYYAAADLVDVLGIEPQRVRDKVRVSRALLLTAAQIARELGPALAETKGGPARVAFVRDLQAYPMVVRVKERVIERTQGPVIEDEACFIDRDFIGSVAWSLKRSLAPKHSIHF